MVVDIFQLNDGHHNKPLDSPALPQSRRSRLSSKAFFAILSILVSLLSVVSALQRAFLSETLKHDYSNHAYPSFFTEPENWSYMMDRYPAHIFSGLGSLELFSANLNLACALIVGGIVAYAPSKGPIKILYALRVPLVLVLATNAALSLAAFLYAFTTYWQSAHFDLAFAFELVRSDLFDIYIRGTFDLATWACETRDLPNFDDGGELRTLCAMASGARWATPILFLLASALFILIWLDQRGEQRLIKARKYRRASWHEDYC
ncbi:hypothetical protein F5Y09DRAFT_317744 [Xylaria sp. FL1042]|nr:hypothetical protein F5Y09DRAFT_317744 [Xylaria sp. FL1042]